MTILCDSDYVQVTFSSDIVIAPHFWFLLQNILNFNAQSFDPILELWFFSPIFMYCRVIWTHVYHFCAGPRGEIETATFTGMTLTPPTPPYHNTQLTCITQQKQHMHTCNAAGTVFRMYLLMFGRLWHEIKGSEREECVDRTNRPK